MYFHTFMRDGIGNDGKLSIVGETVMGGKIAYFSS